MTNMATIKAIEARTVHQIQSGQVIVDLCSVVKELVENSIDAGATNIEVRFKNQGLDSIEVQDNGSGVSRENYETLALKHYTSKLSTYADLTSLQTFGFRGEALSSLCALSTFTVTTCLPSDAPKGSKLEFETSGKLRSTSMVAVQKGTTITVEGLFNNLPVRRRELERNIKREWNKVLVVLNQYACIKTGLKFSVSQQPNKGKRMVLFSTQGNQSTRENILNVFGAKTLTVLIPLDLKFELEPTSTPAQRLVAHENAETQEIRVQGHVSRPAYGEGRQTPDRQMFFVNGRPCGLPQFAKIFNEVYKSYNTSQSPFIFADIQLDTHLYDVNVSPDKRTIMLHDQTRLLDNLRESLSTLFDSQNYALPTSQLGGTKQTPFKRPSPGRNDNLISQFKPTASGLATDEALSVSVSTDLDAPGEGKEDVSRDEANHSGAAQRSSLPGFLSREEKGHALVNQSTERECDLRTDAVTRNSERTETRNSRARDVAMKPASTHTLQNTAVTSSEANENSEDDPSSVAISAGTSQCEASSCARIEKTRQHRMSEDEKDQSCSENDTTEPPIPAITAPSRVSDVKLGRALPRLKRSAPEVATITIGDHTVTSIIGSPSKKNRTESPQVQKPRKQGLAKGAVPVPSFNGRLTQMFAAQTQAQQTRLEQLEVTNEMRDNSDHSDTSSEGLFVGDSDHELENSAEAATTSLQDQSVVAQSRNSPRISHASDARASEPFHHSSSASEDDDVSDRGDVESVHEDGEDTGQETNGPVEDSVHISEDLQKRQHSFVKGNTKKKDSTCSLQQLLRTDTTSIRDALNRHIDSSAGSSTKKVANLVTDKLDADDAEEKLSLTISKADFGKMKIIGQFNLGFILASRPSEDPNGVERDDELFIIDQHATDEKYNFERLQANTVVQSQRLVHPKMLELTAVEEDIVQENLDALEANGFIVEFDDSGDEPVGTRCKLLSLPLSRETTFSLQDLEELISLLQDHQSSANMVPRPSKVRKMFAMRACRSSVMIGKPLSKQQMEKLVRHMGELDKPWNCPHGRPTMRHLCGLGAWDEMGWREGDGFDGERPAKTKWGAYVREANEF
ncbi:DNA mismatch repair protein MutL [Xylariaceae sp. FL0016]|nr:DNA mismatch repair protein MutL [Xylariaceae sp. FL0016]